MVAAQYILVAGRRIAENCFTKPVRGFGPDEWRRWTGKLGEISRQEGGNTGLASAAEEAYKCMVSLQPEKFLVASQDRRRGVVEPPEERVLGGDELRKVRNL
jgi:hypothetical protein